MNQRAGIDVNPKPAEARVAGHFGELAQGLAGPGGPVALVTLPCPALVTRVAYAPARGALTTSEPVSEKALRAARLALAELGRERWGGQLAIERSCPPGLGAGTSTAETLGAIRAVATAFGTTLAPETEARLCLAAEGAVDPLMHGGTVLFASREGRVLREFPALPAMRLVGGFAGPPVATDARDARFPDAAALFAEIEAALAVRDLVRLARAATRSAERAATSGAQPALAGVRAVAAETGALGIAIAHTGAAIALIFPPGAGTAEPRSRLAAAGLTDLLAWDLP